MKNIGKIVTTGGGLFKQSLKIQGNVKEKQGSGNWGEEGVSFGN